MKIQQAKALFFAQYPYMPLVFMDREYDGIHISYEQQMTGELIQVDFKTLAICAKVQFSEEHDHYEYYEIDNEAHLILRSVSQLTDEEAIQVARFSHQKPNTDFEVKRDSDLIHVQHTDKYGITSHISLYKNYGTVNSNVHFIKTKTEEFKTYKANIGETTLSSRRPVPYIAICDYMRSIGILLQFTYLNEESKPITLQPDEIIKLGWAKYLES